MVKFKNRKFALLLSLFIPAITQAQWRPVTGQTDLDASRFDTPEQVQSFLRSHYSSLESSEYQYLVDWINPELSYPDGRYSFRICFTPTATQSNLFNPVTCSAGTTSGHLHTDFIVPVDLDKTTLLNKDLGLVCPLPGQDDPTMVGNPINAATGNKFEVERDYVGGGQQPLEFARFYNSRLAINSPANAWRHSYSSFIEADPKKNGISTVILHRPDGKQLAFYRTRDGWFPTWKTDDKLTEVNGVFASATATLNGFTYSTALTDFNNDGWVYTRSDAVVETYNHDGLLTEIRSPDGNKLSLLYVNNELQSVTNSYGRTLTFQSSNNHVLSMTAPDGSTTNYQYNENGLLQSVIRPDGQSREYLYEDGRNNALLTGIKDENGVRYASWSYNDDLNAISSEHAGGVALTNINYRQSSSVEIINPLGHRRELNFSLHNGQLQTDSVSVAAATGVAAGSTTYSFSSQGTLSGKTNAEGQSFGYAYNTRGLETQRTSDDGGTISTTWHNTYALPIKIIYPTLTAEYTYDDNLNVTAVKQTERSGTGTRLWSYTWSDTSNHPSQLLSIDGPRTDVDDTTKFTYDNQGDLTQIVNPLNQITKYSNYDANGRPGSVVTPDGIEKALTYDYRGLLSSVSDRSGSITLTRDPVGRLVRTTLQDGTSITYEYDDAGRLIATTNAKGEKREYTLDAADNITAIRLLDTAGALRWSEVRTYNELSNLLTVTNGLGNTSSFSWDRVANMLSETDAAGHITQNVYDGFQHRIKETNAAAGVSSRYKYDGNGRLTYVADLRAKNTAYTRNGFGDVVTQSSPDTGTTTFTYDSAGNIITRTDALGQKTTLAYDALNRLTSIVSSVPTTPSIELRYDENTQGTGRLTSVHDAAGYSLFGYDDFGQLASVVRGSDYGAYVMSMKYDNTGRLVSQTYPSGRILSYLRDSAGSVTGLKVDAPNGSSTLLASDITYAPDGPLTHITYGNGLSEDRTYNLNYQPESIYVGNVLNRSYEYSSDGNIINARDNLNPVYGHAASYDAIDRLVQSTGWYGVYSFTYDASGNRTSITRAGTKDTYSISTSNNYLTKTSVSAASYTYDATGNITKRGTDVFTYNGYGQLTTATINGAVAQYKYNLSGLRVSKTVSGQTTLYFYDNDGRLLSEVDTGTGAVNREYIWLGTKPVAYLAGEQVYFIHTDNTETPQLLTNSQGNVVWTVQTYPFGKQSYAGNVAFNLRYPGQYFDEESGLHYNWHRYYDPNTGRYITSDPIGLAGGLNTFAYVGNNPLGSIDPDGLMAIPYPFIPPVVPGNTNTDVGLPHYPGWSTGSDFNNQPLPAWTGTPLRSGGRNWSTQNNEASDCDKATSPNINPQDVAGKTPEEIDELAKGYGLIPKGDPITGRGSYLDPETDEQRILIHPTPKDCSGPHCHVNDSNGNRLDINGNQVAPETPEAHLPLRYP